MTLAQSNFNKKKKKKGISSIIMKDKYISLKNDMTSSEEKYYNQLYISWIDIRCAV